jgi:hypothetical protein
MKNETMRRLRVLVAYSMSSSHVTTTFDYMHALSLHTDFDVTYLHVTQNAKVVVELSDYDVVFNNYCARLCFKDYVSDSYQDELRAFQGLKIISVQDVYNRTNTLREAISDLGFHVVMVSAPVESFDYIFGPQRNRDVTYIPTLTGFAPDPESLVDIEVKPLNQRSVDVAYRGRDIGPLYGILGFLKYEIGRVVREACDRRGIPHNIAMDEDSRIYGRAWYEFIASARTMLGTDSGSNVIDFDGELEAHFKKLRDELGGRPLPYEPYLPLVAEHEKHVNMSEASPRLFECAALKTAMVLLRGHYSGVVEAEKHYIPLERDFSNLDDVLDQLTDIEALQQMADRTYDDLIASDRFSYRQFGRTFQDTVTAALTARPQLVPANSHPALAPLAKLKPGESMPTTSPRSSDDFQKWLAYQSSPKWFPLLIKRIFSRVPILARFTNKLG